MTADICFHTGVHAVNTVNSVLGFGCLVVLIVYGGEHFFPEFVRFLFHGLTHMLSDLHDFLIEIYRPVDIFSQFCQSFLCNLQLHFEDFLIVLYFRVEKVLRVFPALEIIHYSSEH